MGLGFAGTGPQALNSTHEDTMNKLNSFLAAGLFSVASAGIAVTPVFAAGGAPNPTTEQQAMPTDRINGATHATKHAGRAAHVERVQQALNKNGASLAVDGKWGPKTKAAVMDYQKAHNLKATGRLDKATRTQLLKA
jgi:peptidoglycan hydrolase-like protein with peptidoglycan-binding domain